MRTLIIDDEDPARELIASYVEKIDDLTLIGSFDSPLKALHLISQGAVDLVFLDIQMPEMKGTEFLASLSPKPHVIFTTAYSEYALESYDLEAIDYLLKPIRFERFLKAMQKVLQREKSEPNSSTILDETLTIKSGYELHKVPLKDILYIEGMKEYVAYHTPKGRIMSLQSLKSLTENLPSDSFVRTHRSYIVNKRHVRSLVNRSLTVGNAELPVGESYFEQVKARLFG
ncbi:MAG: LytTR family DNA-binding domain-containing protein [Bacteroidota bacterium]